MKSRNFKAKKIKFASEKWHFQKIYQILREDLKRVKAYEIEVEEISLEKGPRFVFKGLRMKVKYK